MLLFACKKERILGFSAVDLLMPSLLFSTSSPFFLLRTNRRSFPQTSLRGLCATLQKSTSPTAASISVHLLPRT
jgi:hypothetical protein